MAVMAQTEVQYVRWRGGTLDTLETARGRLMYRFWPLSRPEPRRVVACIPGLGGTSEEFIPMGKFMAAQIRVDDTLVYAPALEGCGDSQGRRGLIDLGGYQDNIHQILRLVRESHPESALFLLGYSLGGALVVRYVARYPDAVQGLVLVAPAVRAAFRPSLAFYGRALWGLLFARSRPVPFLPSEQMQKSLRGQYLMEHPKAIEAWYPSSFLVLRRLLAGLRADARRVTVPTLIVQGDQDKEVVPEGARRLYRWLRSQDRELVWMEGADHFFYDAFSAIDTGAFSVEQRASVLRRIDEWLVRHS